MKKRRRSCVKQVCSSPLKEQLKEALQQEEILIVERDVETL
jgi:hypothetical protein